MLGAGGTADKSDQDIKKPVTKAGKIGAEPKELRPITLLCEILKMWEGWVHQLWSSTFVGSKEQAGFKKGYSCVGQLFVLRMMAR